jgi:hypothetical protein
VIIHSHSPVAERRRSVAWALALTVEAHEAIRRARVLGGASLFAIAAAKVLIDDAKLAWIECRMSSLPGG